MLPPCPERGIPGLRCTALNNLGYDVMIEAVGYSTTEDGYSALKEARVLLESVGLRFNEPYACRPSFDHRAPRPMLVVKKPGALQ